MPSLYPHTYLRACGCSDTCSGSSGSSEGQSRTGSARDCPQPWGSLEGRNPLSGFPPLGAPQPLCSHVCLVTETSLPRRLGRPWLASLDW